MALHFSGEEFQSRFDRLKTVMETEKLDAILMFAQESMYWLTGYDTFGFCFFQCLVVTQDGRKVLLTRSADQRQAKHTSNISDIRIWIDSGGANPVLQLKDLLFDMDLLGSRIGIEYDTHGMTGRVGLSMEAELSSFADIQDASGLVDRLRSVKSPAEIAYVREAAKLADAAYYAAFEEVRPGASEARILAVMQNAVLEGGGDCSANPFVIGSGRDALLCRYKSGRRTLGQNDQLTLEWAGSYNHYHAALMRTVVIGSPTERHHEMYIAAREALTAVETQLVPGRTFGNVFEAHAECLDSHGLMPHRLNSCGYSLGARFAPSWMDAPMAFKSNTTEIEAGMVLFMHMILLDSITETAMCVGQTYLTTHSTPESLSTLPLDLPVKSG
ncbi:aminopeptidase P family protein [Roseibium denhamense]|uniref:Xaa-Pro dipeptidase n=1 Tax=Roseibium denhamense TaxID=76305 RepID=A0ABY1NEZ6_9HYPH|nr:Xaa-Pro peptidase family protein [Roseibium denhamense]MTI04130.1 aminopeptidase P family protein [Roseibium denhamense]SMP08069.1 Xaa-Pro dipeptidase [Roseibium denhamense]